MNKKVLRMKNEADNCSEERKLLFRKGVSGLVINSKNEFLLVNLESFEDKYFAIPGGGVEQEETLKDAAYRELNEELGIKQKHLQIVGQSNIPVRFKFKEIKMNRDGVEYDGTERHFFGFKFIGNESDIKLQKSEIRSCKWVSYENLKDYLLFDDQLKDTQEKILELFPYYKKSHTHHTPHELPNARQSSTKT